MNKRSKKKKEKKKESKKTFSLAVIKEQPAENGTGASEGTYFDDGYYYEDDMLDATASFLERVVPVVSKGFLLIAIGFFIISIPFSQTRYKDILMFAEKGVMFLSRNLLWITLGALVMYIYFMYVRYKGKISPMEKIVSPVARGILPIAVGLFIMSTPLLWMSNKNTSAIEPQNAVETVESRKDNEDGGIAEFTGYTFVPDEKDGTVKGKWVPGDANAEEKQDAAAGSEKEVVAVHDEVEYENLFPGKEYTITGTVITKEDSAKVRDNYTFKNLDPEVEYVLKGTLMGDGSKKTKPVDVLKENFLTLVIVAASLTIAGIVFARMKKIEGAYHLKTTVFLILILTYAIDACALFNVITKIAKCF